MQEVNTQEEFDSIIASNERVAVFFKATWCGVCRSIKPRMEEVEEDFPSIKFLMVDVDQDENTAAHHGIRSVPTMKFFGFGSKFGSELIGLEIQSQMKSMLENLSYWDGGE
jgi:thioredoxin 1